jgi:hypothetical protein
MKRFPVGHLTRANEHDGSPGGEQITVPIMLWPVQQAVPSLALR